MTLKIQWWLATGCDLNQPSAAVTYVISDAITCIYDWLLENVQWLIS